MSEALRVEADKYIARAAEHDITLSYKDFEVIDGEIWLDGMDPGDWIDAMTTE